MLSLHICPPHTKDTLSHCVYHVLYRVGHYAEEPRLAQTLHSFYALQMLLLENDI